MAAVRQLAGERKGLGSGAQSARQANSLLANLQTAGVDRAALAAAAATAAAAIRVVSRRRRRRRSRCRAWRSAGRLRPPAPMVQWADEKRPARRRARRRDNRDFRILHELYLVRCSLP